MLTLKRIDESVAHNYIPVSEDYTQSEPAFYTLTTTSEDPEWSIITYYTARRQNQYEHINSDGTFWVFILANKTMPNLVKIGFTKKSPYKRAEEISHKMGVSPKFTVEFACKCFNNRVLKSKINKHLQPYKIDGEGFFQISVDKAKESIILLEQRYIK